MAEDQRQGMPAFRVPTDEESAQLYEEDAARHQHTVDALTNAEPIACARCEIELGTGPGTCRRAPGTDLCLECALFETSPEPKKFFYTPPRR
jgi:hypothetical protein